MSSLWWTLSLLLPATHGHLRHSTDTKNSTDVAGNASVNETSDAINRKSVSNIRTAQRFDNLDLGVFATLGIASKIKQSLLEARSLSLMEGTHVSYRGEEKWVKSSPCAGQQFSDYDLTKFPTILQQDTASQDESFVSKFSTLMQGAKSAFDSSTLPVVDQNYLARILHWSLTKFSAQGKTFRSVETGLANGGSALAILGSVVASDISSFDVIHHAYDPEQSYWNDTGVNLVDTFVAEHGAASKVGFKFFPKPAAIGLASLEDEGKCIHVAFLDDGHKFDDNMVELYFVNRLLPPGGLLIFDDAHMPSVKAATNFIDANLPYERMKNSAERFVVYLKTGEDNKRDWQHFNGFDSWNVVTKK